MGSHRTHTAQQLFDKNNSVMLDSVFFIFIVGFSVYCLGEEECCYARFDLLQEINILVPSDPPVIGGAPVNRHQKGKSAPKNSIQGRNTRH